MITQMSALLFCLFACFFFFLRFGNGLPWVQLNTDLQSEFKFASRFTGFTQATLPKFHNFWHCSSCEQFCHIETALTKGEMWRSISECWAHCFLPLVCSFMAYLRCWNWQQSLRLEIPVSGVVLSSLKSAWLVYAIIFGHETLNSWTDLTDWLT